jgi:hypothetical protein
MARAPVPHRLPEPFRVPHPLTRGITIARRKSMSPSALRVQIVLFTMIVAVVTLYAAGIMANTGDVLLGRLDLIAETDLLNR